MPEEMEVGIDRVQDTIEEHRRELAEEEKEKEKERAARPRWIDYLAISTALFAALACAGRLAHPLAQRGQSHPKGAS